MSGFMLRLLEAAAFCSPESGLWHVLPPVLAISWVTFAIGALSPFLFLDRYERLRSSARSVGVALLPSVLLAAEFVIRLWTGRHSALWQYFLVIPTLFWSVVGPPVFVRSFLRWPINAGRWGYQVLRLVFVIAWFWASVLAFMMWLSVDARDPSLGYWEIIPAECGGSSESGLGR
jgi:hypothetical protein